ncbi:hypothetical protein [Stenotrophomonas oahuensis]|uniref:Uncharacterized protein n=1 Tax=Stenotrophomonas oahuensis TaxID=3003271 RepID=A0ABY9YVY4_9GAMM|nr:hypothetical protein [Stenotrophomonas sp. A5586]WNH54828.1 hypothetical protein PDM29_20660 [Stenotrophomonas sp. A5586]
MNPLPNWKQRYEMLVDLLGIAAPLLADIDRDGLTDEHRAYLLGLRLLVDSELATA